MVPLEKHAHSDMNLLRRTRKPRKLHPYTTVQEVGQKQKMEGGDEGEEPRSKVGGRIGVPVATSGQTVDEERGVGAGEVPVASELGGGGGGGGGGSDSKADITRKTSATESCASPVPPTPPLQDRENKQDRQTADTVPPSHSPNTSQSLSQTSDSESPFESPSTRQRTQPRAREPEPQQVAPSPRLLRKSDRDSEKQQHVYRDLMKALGGSGRGFMLSRQFWNVLFMSTVDVDRNCMGWNERTSELYERWVEQDCWKQNPPQYLWLP